MRPVCCPTGCGSRTFRAIRRGMIAEDFFIDEATDEIVDRTLIAEAGGHLTLSCTECGHSWRSRRDLDLARFMEGPP